MVCCNYQLTTHLERSTHHGLGSFTHARNIVEIINGLNCNNQLTIHTETSTHGGLCSFTYARNNL